MKSLPKNLLEALIRGLSEGLMVLGRQGDEWRSVFFNPAFAELLGRASGELSGQPLRLVLERLGCADEWERTEAALAAGTALQYVVYPGTPDEPEPPLVLRLLPLESNRQAAGGYYVCYLRLRDGAAQTSEVAVGPGEPVPGAERRDAATGLVPRQFFDGVLAHDWAVAQRESQRLALLVFRIDAFRSYLGTFGQHATESMMRRVSRCVTRRLRRASDVAARLEEDCIAALVHGGEEASIREFAASIAAEVKSLGIHHPHSPVARFVTVRATVNSAQPAPETELSEFVVQALAADGS